MRPSPHRHTPATIDLSAIRYNLITIRDHLKAKGKNPEFWPAVKANAYGHGAVEVSKAIEELVEGYCVSNLDEAIELRDAGIEKEILVLSGIVPNNVDYALDLNLSLTAPSLEWLKLILATDKPVQGLKLHLKVDTGMGRIGVRTAEEANQMVELMDSHGIDFTGVFTHFATADEEAQENFNKQASRFVEIVASLPRRPKYVHSTNSAAALWHDGQVQDIERLGAGLYGINPSNGALELPYELKAAFSLKSEIYHCKEITAGDSVGYGATYKAEENTFIGTIPIGYADGWTRDMQGFKVLVDGKFCEIVGRVSMDQMTVKLDKAYPIGTVVTLIGGDGDKKITADDIAQWRHTINYEVLTLLSDRIYRKYLGK
ncbi:MAG: alanine racemase [Streptococcaceae bacterium]|jgi:alanine racemase|nr:alanine racemase [Streptococcaceae bacterium]